jgi:hypothetical protein
MAHTLVLPCINTAMGSVGNSLWNTSQSLADLDASAGLYQLAANTEDPIMYPDITTLLPAFFCIQGELYKMVQITSSVRKTRLFTTLLIVFFCLIAS